MENTREVTLRLNLDNDMVRAWFERLMEGTRHPMYQNGIQLVHTREAEKGH
jgi:hypothetical protein